MQRGQIFRKLQQIIRPKLPAAPASESNPWSGGNSTFRDWKLGTSFPVSMTWSSMFAGGWAYHRGATIALPRLSQKSILDF